MQPSSRAVRNGALLLATAVLAAGFLHVGGSAHPGLAGVTWTGTVARVLETNCVVCHGERGMSAPRLDDYDSARLASQAIKRAVLTRHRPRWHAVSGFGDFANDPSLTSYEIELLAQWADALAPQGDAPMDRGPAPAVEAPDLLLTVPPTDNLAETGRTVRLDTGLTDARAIRGWTFQPGDASAATAAIIALSSGKTLGTWVPGERATFLPDGVTAHLPAGATLRVTVNYRPTARAGSGVSRVGLYFAARPGRELARLPLPCGTTRLRRSIDALAIRPIPGSSAWSLAVHATRPGGNVEPLGRFHDYRRDDAQTYWFRRAVRLPRGTAVDVGATRGTCGAELAYVESAGPVTEHAVARRSTDSHAGAALGTPPSASGSGYWCPMHAAVRAAAPGVCPQCGMALVPVAPAVEGAYGLEAEWLPHRGAGGTLRLLVREPRTATIVRRFETLHERVFHLFVISDDLREFSHVHPVPQPDGSFALSPLPLGSGPYQLFADFLPAGGTPQLIRKTILPARPPAGFSGSPTPHLARETGDKTDAGLRVRIEPVAGTLIAGGPSLIAFHFADAATGAPIADLEPYLGAWGHAFIVSADLADAVHSHPLTPLTSPGGPTVYFQQRFPRAGVFRVWAQFMRNGRVATVSFTVDVAEPRPTS